MHISVLLILANIKIRDKKAVQLTFYLLGMLTGPD